LQAGDAASLYEDLYCARGEAENRIKEAQIDLFGRRGSCRRFASNQLRLLFAALAYTLMINLRRLGLQGTEFERACTATIRVKLLKIGAAVLRNTRRVRLLLASHHPFKHVFLSAARALAPGSCVLGGRNPPRTAPGLDWRERFARGPAQPAFPEVTREISRLGHNPRMQDTPEP
ncbi:hypothetical protein KXX11_003896, partial [Aspergillus fumigatus]